MERALPQSTLGHNKDCRVRMEALLGEDADFKDKLEVAEERKSRYLAEELERADKAPTATPSSGPSSAPAPAAGAATTSSAGASSSTSGTCPEGSRKPEEEDVSQGGGEAQG